MQKRLILCLLISGLFLYSSLFAQEKGTITGTVTDVTNGEALVGANIIVVGSTSLYEFLSNRMIKTLPRIFR